MSAEFLTAPLFWLFAALTLVVFWAVTNIRPGGTDKPKAQDYAPEIRTNKWALLILGALVWVALAGFLAAAGFRLVATFPGSDADSSDIRYHASLVLGAIAALGALVTVVFGIFRVFTTERQTTAQEQGLITDRINKAVENLGATHVLHDADGRQVTEPNLEVRIGAIYALERLAQDSLRDHVQIMEILTAYVRENAKDSTAKHSPHEVFRELTENSDEWIGKDLDDMLTHSRYRPANPYGWHPTELNDSNLKRWAREQLSPREDIRIALRVIGRRSARQIGLEQELGYRIDLNRSNLQGTKLKGNFDHASFADARLDGATLDGSFREAQFGMYAEGALGGASLQAARCSLIDATNADFSAANLDACFFGSASLNDCRFILTKMDHTNLNGAQVQSANFAFTKANQVYCHREALFDRSRFYETSLSEFRGIEDGPTERLWITENVELTNKQKERFPYNGTVAGNELDNRREWTLWKSDPDTYIPPQDRTD